MPFPGSSLRAPLLWLLLPFMAGIAAGAHWPCPPGWLPWFAGLALLTAGAAGLATPHRFWLWAGAMGLTGSLAGDVALRLCQPDEPDPATAPREVSVVVAVDRLYPPGAGRKSQSGLGRILSAEGVADAPLGQRVYFSVVLRGGVPPERAGRYLVRGVLLPLPGEADGMGFHAYLRDMGVRWTLTRAQVRQVVEPPGWWARWANRARAHFDGLLARGIERYPGELALYRGMLLGEKAVLSAEQQEMFTHSGTFHIFVIAGLHIGVIAFALEGVLLLLRVPHRAALVLGLALLGIYVAITGAGLPARRAFLMIALFTTARVGRLPANPLALLTAAALAVLLLEPTELFSTGFQMSFAVVTGLVCLGAPLARRWEAAWQPWALLPPANHTWWQRLVTWLGGKVLGSLAISGTSLVASALPIIASFGVFAPVSLLANLAAVPLAMLAISAGLASLATGLLYLGPAASVFNHAAVVLIKGMEWLVGLGNALPGACFPAHFRDPRLAAPALALVVSVMLLAGGRRWPKRARAPWWPVLALGVVLILGVKFG